MRIRHAEPSDYGRVIGVVNTWWSGRQMAPMLPKLFFVHFEGTSFVAEDEEGELAGFLVGFLSQTHDDEAYVHFVGVDPRRRGSGLGRELYERFFDAIRSEGRHVVRCVTSTVNTHTGREKASSPPVLTLVCWTSTITPGRADRSSVGLVDGSGHLLEALEHAHDSLLAPRSVHPAPSSLTGEHEPARPGLSTGYSGSPV